MEREKPKPLCWGCGYCLEGAVSKRCPECGRAFDPDDPKSMNMSGAAKWWKRIFLLRPIGNVTLTLALLATAALAVVTRVPARSIFKLDWWFGDVQYICAPRSWSDFINKPAERSWVMAVFACALVTWSLILIPTLVRVSVRLALRKKHGDVMLRSPRWRRRLLLAIFFLSLLMVPLGQDFRVAHQWMAIDLAISSPTTPGPRFLTIGMPALSGFPSVSLPPDREREILQTGLRRLPALEMKMAVLRRLTFGYTSQLPDILREEIPRESNPKARAAMMNLLCLFRDIKDLPLMLAEMEHPNPEVRAAAIDAVVILRQPPWRIPETRDNFISEHATLNTTPPIFVTWILSFTPGNLGWVDGRPSEANKNVLDPSIRDRLEQIMLDGKTALEREAAARGLLSWPPEKYDLRAAEWGVWVSDSAGHIEMIRSQLDEIPPFVHQIGNPASEFASRINPVMMIFKPILHLTADQAMPIDLEVHIKLGRPWFAYPRPDDVDFSTSNSGMRYIGATTRSAALEPPANFERLDPLGIGFPWMSPNHRRHGSASGGMGATNDFMDIGLRWQTLIVTPELPAWAKLESTGDPKFEWWNRLRQVKSSYVTSRGETDRFVYYDGPTQAQSPVAVKFDGTKLTFIPDISREIHEGYASETFTPLASKIFSRRGLFVRVKNGVARGEIIDRIPADKEITDSLVPTLADNTAAMILKSISDPKPADDKPAEMLLKMLTDAGMTADEASAMVEVWTPQFFKTDGDRFLLLMSSDDYDAFCPISISPKPSKLVRCGIILTELGEKIRQP